MKRRSSIAGFSVPELLIVLLVLGAVFGVGGYAWTKVSTRSKPTSSKTPVASSTTTDVQERTPISDPYGDWAEYKNNEYGFTFRYPEEWGTVSVTRKALNSEKYETNLPYVVTFRSSDAPFVRIFPSDWKFTSPTQTEWRSPLLREDLEAYQVKVMSDSTKIAAISYSSFSGEVNLAGLKQLTLPKIKAIQIEVHRDDSYDVKRQCLVEQKNKYGSMENMATLDCYSEAYRSNFVKFMDSFRAI